MISGKDLEWLLLRMSGHRILSVIAIIVRIFWRVTVGSACPRLCQLFLLPVSHLLLASCPVANALPSCLTSRYLHKRSLPFVVLGCG